MVCYSIRHLLRVWRAMPFGEVAQLVEQRTENSRVVGSIPTLATIPPPSSIGQDTGFSCL